MADVPVGPGQPESTGLGKSRQAPNVPGLYYEPRSKTYMHVVHPAGADALVRMGFQLKEEGQALTPSMEAKLSGGNPEAAVQEPEAEPDEEVNKSSKKG